MILPRANPHLFGHKAAEAQLRETVASGRIPHAWLFTGPRGVGKATLAYHFVRQLLSGHERIASGAHADLLIVEPEFDSEKDEVKREISVEAARKIPEFFSKTSAEGKWRVAIVDSVDAMNASASNALLKTLEEPPANCCLLLISHRPGMLLPTIRSRCRPLRLSPLAPQEFSQTVLALNPEIALEEIDSLGELSGYAPGAALEMAGQGVNEILDELYRIISNPSSESIQIFVDDIAGTGSGQKARWELLARLTQLVLTQAAIGGKDPAGLRSRAPAHVWARFATHAAEQFSLAERARLDYKTVLYTLLEDFRNPYNVLSAA